MVDSGETSAGHLLITFCPNITNRRECLLLALAMALPSQLVCARTGDEPSLFRDATWEWGLIAQHQQRRDHLTGLSDTLGAGACVLDINNDGWMDVLLVGGSGQRREHGAANWWQTPRGHRLFQNNSGRGFIDITQGSGLVPSWGMGCATGDLDGDGDEDVVITGFNGAQLYENTGAGKFQIVSGSGLDGGGWASSATIADFNQDGRLDIYINAYLDYQRGARTFEALSGFKSLTPADFNPRLYDPLPNRMLINQGGLRFEDRAEAWGVGNPEGRSLQSIWWPAASKLVVLNDAGSPLVQFQQGKANDFSRQADGWRSTEPKDKGDKWAPDEIGGAIDELLAREVPAQKVYGT